MAHIDELRDRADMLARVRSFFSARGIVEVDTPHLAAGVVVDAHIDLIPAARQYLQSSPEAGMKKLLAEGIGDCYQLAHVFRDNESGPLHLAEFMMIEWYRLGLSFEQMIIETCDVIQLFLGDTPVKTVSYRDALLQHAEIDPMTASDEEVVKRAAECGVYEGIDLEGRDGYLNVILGSVVEPQLGRNGLTVLMHYPPSQAALAQTAMCDGFLVAERFEIYYRGVELANGYHELSNSEEQRSRFIEANALRIKLGKNPLPIDEAFLKAVDLLPDCCGVSVGFDRVQMLRRGKTHLQN